MKLVTGGKVRAAVLPRTGLLGRLKSVYYKAVHNCAGCNHGNSALQTSVKPSSHCQQQRAILTSSISLRALVNEPR